MKNIGIGTACSENWNNMSPTEKGAFCQQCAKQVYDFSTKSTTEIKRTLLELQGKEICGRMTVAQEVHLNQEFNAWLDENKTNFQRLFITALVIVFGLTLFSCEDERDQQKIAKTQSAFAQIIQDSEIVTQNITETVPEKTLVNENEAPIDVPHFEIATIDTIEGFELDDIVITAPMDNEEYYTMGIIVSDRNYVRYLNDTLPQVEMDENGIPYPTAFSAIAFPNPAVDNTTLEIQLPQTERMEIRIFDSGGKFIQSVYSGEIQRGHFRQGIELNGMQPGMYLIIIQSKNFNETIRVIKT